MPAQRTYITSTPIPAAFQSKWGEEVKSKATGKLEFSYKDMPSGDPRNVCVYLLQQLIHVMRTILQFFEK